MKRKRRRLEGRVREVEKALMEARSPDVRGALEAALAEGRRRLAELDAHEAPPERGALET
jgi:hypothetical protein